MMKSAEDRSSNDLTEPLDRATCRCILGQSKMRPNMVVVGSIGLEHSAQVVFTQDHDVIEALPTNRADQPLRFRRRRSWRRVTNADSSRKLMVDTTRKSMAPMPAAWLPKKVFHVWPDLPGRRLAMYLATVDCATSILSVSNSP